MAFALNDIWTIHTTCTDPNQILPNSGAWLITINLVQDLWSSIGGDFNGFHWFTLLVGFAKQSDPSSDSEGVALNCITALSVEALNLLLMPVGDQAKPS